MLTEPCDPQGVPYRLRPSRYVGLSIQAPWCSPPDPAASKQKVRVSKEFEMVPGSVHRFDTVNYVTANPNKCTKTNGCNERGMCVRMDEEGNPYKTASLPLNAPRDPTISLCIPLLTDMVA